MAASESGDSSVDGSGDGEREEFMRKLQEYHDTRGTLLESAPKVGSKIVDLHKLYKRVTEEGGYDVVSDTRSNKLMWRKLGQDFHLGSAASPTLAFTLKTVYYKNLAAYEIQHFHNREPPPKDILEDVTAKGGDLLNRTVENFQKPLTKEERLAEAAGIDSMNNDRQTPSKENGEPEEPGSTGARATRGLRQAPPPRQLYQGEVTQPRTTRQVSKEASSPVPNMNPYATTNGILAANGVPQSLATYEPRSQHPAQLRPVMTPGNNFEKFKEEQKRIRDARATYLRTGTSRHRSTPGLVPPGTGFQGPTIYTRTLQSLQSGILEEQEYSLYHLTKISHERGDRFRFDHFQGLAESLIQKVLEVGPLVLDVVWNVITQATNPAHLERIHDSKSGSMDILGSIEFSRKRKRNDKLEPEEFSRRMCLVNEAGLILRNMVMMDFNADYVSRFPVSRALLIILLNLPKQANTTEIQQYGLDMAEQLTRYFIPQDNDELFQSLVRMLDSNDRGIILSAIRSICRMGIVPQQAPHLQDIPPHTIQRLQSWMVVEDEELRSAALDLLYQYTIQPENVETFIQHTNVETFVRQLTRFLLHGARHEERKEGPAKIPAMSNAQGSTGLGSSSTSNIRDIEIPRISQDHVESLLAYNEPDRSTQWLRACFEEDAEGEITQIALWQAYQIPFAPYAATHPLLPAKDFITNVSNTFSKASAQVMSGDNGQARFVIKGIKARRIPIDPKGRRFLRCLWKTEADQPASTDGETTTPNETKECGVFARDAKAMWEHILNAHLSLAKNPDNDNRYDFTPKPGVKYTCRWADCKRFGGVGKNSKTSANPYMIGMHVKTHLPDTSEKAFQKSKHNQERTDEEIQKESGDFFAMATRTFQSRNTAVDERNEAAGLPLTSCLVLRNLAKNIPKLDYMDSKETKNLTAGAEPTHVSMNPANSESGLKSSQTPSHRRQDLMSVCFAGVKEQIFGVMAVNQSLKDYLPSLLQAIEDGGG